MPSIMYLDLETQNKPYFGAVAPPRHPDNYVVMNGYAIDSGPVITDHYKSKAEVPDVWLKIPDDCWLIVCHNAPYEMDWFLHQQREVIMKYLQRGGRIWCTAYAEYLLEHQLVTYPSLNDTAPKYGGTQKVDGIKILWEQGILTEDIDPELLFEYLSGPGGDVENTRRIFLGQYSKLTQNGMLMMFFERMEGLIFNCFAMDAGLYVDRDIAFRQRDEGEARLAVLTESFKHYRSHIPEIVKFNPGSDFHMSAWLFGGPIKYVGRELAIDANGNQKYVKGDFLIGDPKQGREGMNREVFEGDNLEVLDFDFGPFIRYKAGKNKGELKVERLDTPVPLMRNADMVFTVGPLADLSLFGQSLYKEFKKEFTGKQALADLSPVFSTSGAALEMLALREEFPEHVRKVLKDLQEWAKLDKDMGTYYLRETFNDDGLLVKQAGMLQYLTPAGIVHHMLNCTSTVTTRLSSNKPNMQNLPRGDTSGVKLMFTSRFGGSGQLVEVDYSALEVVTLCAFSKDEALTKAMLAGTDMHCLRLSQQLKEDYEEVKRKCKDETHPDHARYSLMRTNIKPKAFAYQYGATAHGIAFSTGCTVEDAQLFIDTEKALFPGVEAFFDNDVMPTVERNTSMHREQDDNGNWHMYGRGHWRGKAGTCYSFRQYKKNVWANGQKTETLAYKPTQMRNYPIQGESGFFVQGIAGLVMRWLVSTNFLGNRVHIINTVHDCLQFDCHKDVVDELAGNVKRIMESLPQHFNKNHGYDLNVPFPVAVEVGPSLGALKHWHPKQ